MSAALLPYMEETFGSWYVAGGIRALAQAVYERCLARKVEFVFGAEVARVVEKDGRAAGVELATGTVAGADHVVLGAWPRPGLVPGQELWRDGDVTAQPRPHGPGDGAGPVPGPAVAEWRPARGDGAPDGGARRGRRGGTRGGVRWPARRASHGDGDPPGRSVDPPRRRARGRDSDGDGRPARRGGLDGRGAVRAVCGHLDRGGLRCRPRYTRAAAPRRSAYARPDGGRHRRRGRLGARTGAGRGRGRVSASGEPHAAAGSLPRGRLVPPGGGLAHAGMSGTLVAGLIVEGDGFRGSR